MSHNIPEQFKKGYVPPFQTQPNAPGQQRPLDPEPINDVTADGKPYKFASKLQGHAALITGADSGIGRAVAILFGECLSVHVASLNSLIIVQLSKAQTSPFML